MGYTISNDSFTVPVSVLVVKNQNLGLLFMIDSGEGLNLTNGHSQLLNSLNCLKIDPNSIQHIILTHGHPDHCGGLVGADGVTPVFSKCTSCYWIRRIQLLDATFTKLGRFLLSS